MTLRRESQSSAQVVVRNNTLRTRQKWLRPWLYAWAKGTHKPSFFTKQFFLPSHEPASHMLCPTTHTPRLFSHLLTWPSSAREASFPSSGSAGGVWIVTDFSDRLPSLLRGDLCLSRLLLQTEEEENNITSYSTEQGMKCAAPLPATRAPSIRSAKFVLLLINIDSGCDKTSSGGGRKGLCPDKLTWQPGGWDRPPPQW